MTCELCCPGFFVSPALIPALLRCVTVALLCILAILSLSIHLTLWFFLSIHDNSFSWAPYLCSLSYAIRLALMKEFGDCAKAGVSSCERVINDLKINEGDEWWYWLILVMLFVVFRLSALYLLKKKGSIFF